MQDQHSTLGFSWSRPLGLSSWSSRTRISLTSRHVSVYSTVQYCTVLYCTVSVGLLDTWDEISWSEGPPVAAMWCLHCLSFMGTSLLRSALEMFLSCDYVTVLALCLVLNYLISDHIRRVPPIYKRWPSPHALSAKSEFLNWSASFCEPTNTFLQSISRWKDFCLPVNCKGINKERER